MYLFLICFFPFAFAFYSALCVNSNDAFVFKKTLRISASGIVLSVIFCFIHAFFVFEPSYNGENIGIYILRKWITLALIPLFIYFFLALWFKGKIQTKIKAFLSFMLPFYAVYLPFFVMSEKDNSFFQLFVKPVLYFLYLLPIYAEMNRLLFVPDEKSKRKPRFNILFVIFLSLVPACVEAVWFYNFDLTVSVAIYAVCALFCLFRCAANLSNRAKSAA